MSITSADKQLGSGRLGLRLGVLAGGALAAALMLAACGGGSGPIARVQQVGGPSESSPRYPGAIVLPQPAPKPDITLTDTAGQPYDLPAQTAGKVMLLYFGYTHCPDVCPINMALTARAVQDMPASMRSKVTVVFITTDPRRDSPTVIRAWLNKFDPAFVGLTGTVAQIHAAETTVGMPLSFATEASTPSAGAYEVVHAGYLLGYSQDNVAHLQIDDSETASNYATTLEHLVAHGFQT